MPSLFKKPTAEVEIEPEPVKDGKGKATPTRKEAQAARRAPGSRPASRPGVKGGDPKASKKAIQAQRRAKAAEYRAAMNSGDVSKLPPRERVAERVMARDIVDQRKNLGPPLLSLIVISYFAGIAPVSVLKVAAIYVLILSLIGIVADSFYVGRLVTRQIHEKYPNSTVKVKGYVAQRAILPARWRQPRPRPDIEIGRWLPRR
jgi:Protein of unknown function (DUF3043)